jgi:hypothetical protein
MVGLAVAIALAVLSFVETGPTTPETDIRAALPEVAEEPPTSRGTDSADASDAEDGKQQLWSGDGHRIVSVQKGERVGVHERPDGRLVERAGPKTEFGSRRTFSVLARRGGWLKVTTPIAEANRELWFEADPRRLRFYSTPLSLHASLSDRRVELRRGEEVVRSFEVTIGAAGSSTPPGRFAVTDLIVGGLNPVYGCCAIAVSAHQPDRPEGWIGGDRIAIHGTTGPIGSASSGGCLRAEDEDARALTEELPLGTPVFITA